MGRENDLNGIKPREITIAPGATNAVLISQDSGEISSGIKYFSGGSLLALQCPVGTTLTNAQLVSALTAKSFYLFGTTEALNFDGAVRYYLMAIGATTVAYQLKGLSTGF